MQAIAVNSATSGLHLALESLGIGKGDEVLLPTLTFTATAEVIRYLGATPVFVDVDRTMNIDVDLLKSKLTKKTKAIVPVHFGGRPCNMKVIWKFAQMHGLGVVEDAAHALGSKYYGNKVGNGYSDATVFSFYATKCITTGEGGMVVTKNDYLANRMCVMRLHGISRDVSERYRGTSTNWEYDVIAPGFKYNMPDVLAAIGVEQLKKSEKMRHVRESIAKVYLNELCVGGRIVLPKYDDNLSWHLFVIQLENRNEFIEKMFKEGVACSVHFKPLHQMSVWKLNIKGKFPIADVIFDHCVSLPIYSKMTATDVMTVVEAVKKCIKT